MDDEIFKQQYEATLGGADGEKQVDHSDDLGMTPRHENTAPVWLFQDEPEAAHMGLPIGAKFLLLSKKFEKQICELGEILKCGWFDSDVWHGRLAGIPPIEDNEDGTRAV
jgi:hypothetical protein